MAREPERGFEEKPVEIRPPCCLLIGGDESHFHLLTKHFPKHSGNANDRGQAVRVLALEREHECIDGDCRRVGPPRHITIGQPVVPSCEEVHWVRTIPTVDHFEDLRLDTNVGVIVLPA